MVAILSRGDELIRPLGTKFSEILIVILVPDKCLVLFFSDMHTKAGGCALPQNTVPVKYNCKQQVSIELILTPTKFIFHQCMIFVLWEFCVVSLFGVTFNISFPAENKGFGRNDAECILKALNLHSRLHLTNSLLVIPYDVIKMGCGSANDMLPAKTKRTLEIMLTY